MSRLLLSQVNLSLTWLVALPTVARWDGRLAGIIAVFIACGAGAALIGLLILWEGVALYFVRRDATVERQRRDLMQRDATGAADLEYTQAQDKFLATVREENRELRGENQRLQAENVELKRQFGRRKEDKPS